MSDKLETYTLVKYGEMTSEGDVYMPGCFGQSLKGLKKPILDKDRNVVGEAEILDDNGLELVVTLKN